MIRYECPACGGRLGSDDSDAGRRVECFRCGSPVRVPRDRKTRLDRLVLAWMPAVVMLVVGGCVALACRMLAGLL